MQPPNGAEYEAQFRHLIESIYHAGFRAGFHKGVGAAEFTLYRLRGEDKGIGAKGRRQMAEHIEAKIAAERADVERLCGPETTYPEFRKEVQP